MAKETLSSAAVNTILQGTNAPTTGLSVVGSAIAATATGTVEVFDKEGNSLGYVPLFDTANLT